jgi:putative MATE family efflux protein
MGVSGAAYTNIISQSLGVVLGLRVLFTGSSRLRLSLKGFKVDFNMIWRIVRIGFPASISGIQRSLSQFFLQIFIAPFGSAALAAHVIAQRLEMFMLMPVMSFGQGAGVLVGQNLGAKQPERAEKSAWLAAGLVEAFIITISLAIFIWTRPVVHIFSNDPTLETVAIQFIHISIAGWILMGFMFVMMNSLQGAGDTMPTMIISVVTNWVLTIPLAYFLPKYTDWGVTGIRWVMSASVIFGALANIIYFRTGRWKTRRI